MLRRDVSGTWRLSCGLRTSTSWRRRPRSISNWIPTRPPTPSSRDQGFVIRLVGSALPTVLALGARPTEPTVAFGLSGADGTEHLDGQGRCPGLAVAPAT
jgi:hypothetical protein